jgi:phage gp16-like protein
VKEQFTEKEQADGSKKKISQGMLTLEDATTFYASMHRRDAWEMGR